MLIRDHFSRVRAAGSVIGSADDDGPRRGGIDTDSVMAIDGGALRLGWMPTCGWGRQALTYAPHDTGAGVGFGVVLVHGHMNSRADDAGETAGRDRLRRAAWRVLDRTGTDWMSRVPPNPPGPRAIPPLEDNMAIGWFGPDGPVGEGSGLLVRAGGADNGTLCVRVEGRWVPMAAAVDLPLVVVVVRTPIGAVTAVGSIPPSDHLPAAPILRPVGFDPAAPGGQLRPGLHTSVLGERGFRVDSRVFETTVFDELGGLFPVDGAEPTGLLAFRLGAGPIEVTGSGWGLERSDDGWTLTVGADAPSRLDAPVGTTLQVVHGGGELHVLIDGRTIGEPVPVVAEPNAIVVSGDHHDAVRFAAAIECPVPLDLTPLTIRAASEPAPIIDDFATRDAAWTRFVGTGSIAWRGDGSAAMEATATAPVPDRTVYARPCPFAGGAAIDIDIELPGVGPDGTDTGRPALVFAQDERNYLIANLYMSDNFPGGVSSFFHFEGSDDLFHAVWTNSAGRLRWDGPVNFGLACDGQRYLASIDGSPVLYRAFADVYRHHRGLDIRHVGFGSNWEYGDDTGSVFNRFTMRPLAR